MRSRTARVRVPKREKSIRSARPALRMLFLWGHIFRDTAARCALCVVSQQLLVEIDRDGELADADVLVFSVHGCVLLVVDVDGREADHGVGEVCEASRVRACRQDERGDGSIGKDRLRRFLHVLIAAAVKGRGLVVFVVLVAQDDLHAVMRCHLAQGVEIFFKVRVVDAAQKCLRPAGAVVFGRDVLERAARAEHFTRRSVELRHEAGEQTGKEPEV